MRQAMATTEESRAFLEAAFNAFDAIFEGVMDGLMAMRKPYPVPAPDLPWQPDILAGNPAQPIGGLGGGGTGGTETPYAFSMAGAKRDIGKETREGKWNVDPMPKLQLNTAGNIRKLMRNAKEHILDGNSFIGYDNNATTINTSALAYPFIPRTSMGSGISFSVGGGGSGSKGGG